MSFLRELPENRLLCEKAGLRTEITQSHYQRSGALRRAHKRASRQHAIQREQQGKRQWLARARQNERSAEPCVHRVMTGVVSPESSGTDRLAPSDLRLQSAWPPHAIQDHGQSEQLRRAPHVPVDDHASGRPQSRSSRSSPAPAIPDLNLPCLTTVNPSSQLSKTVSCTQTVS